MSPMVVMPVKIITANPTKLITPPMQKTFSKGLASLHLDINGPSHFFLKIWNSCPQSSQRFSNILGVEAVAKAQI